jgi:hypothetical protein
VGQDLPVWFRRRQREPEVAEVQHALLDHIGARLLDTEHPPDAEEHALLGALLFGMGPVRGSFGDAGRISNFGTGRPGQGCHHLAPYPGCCSW